MEIQTQPSEKGIEIRVKTDQEVALAVKTGEGERIYLPDVEGEDSSYYVEETESLTKVENGYAVLHRGGIEDIEVIG